MSYPIINLCAKQQDYEEVLKLYALGRWTRYHAINWLMVRCGFKEIDAALLLIEVDNQTRGMSYEQIAAALA